MHPVHTRIKNVYHVGMCKPGRREYAKQAKLLVQRPVLILVTSLDGAHPEDDRAIQPLVTCEHRVGRGIEWAQQAIVSAEDSILCALVLYYDRCHAPRMSIGRATIYSHV